METITLAAGCFWCVEAVFQRVRGVSRVESGYANGAIPVEQVNYDVVCTGQTGYAEVVQVDYDADVVPLNVLLDIFFAVHDPTTLNRQGNDVGTQYRSAIFTHNDTQLQSVQDYLKHLQAMKPIAHWQGADVVTQVQMLERYVPAEHYHQQFFQRNPQQPYCLMVAVPKLEKLQRYFAEWVKS